ncbi:MAG: succinate dehydrogenase assembly factor 2 [Pseudomonadota bacterium]
MTLEKRRKRLRFRAWHRGTKELDLLFGKFVDRSLEDLDETQMDQIEELLSLPDPLVYQWLTKKAIPPPEYDSDLLKRMIHFIHEGKSP